jgi:glucosamine kinase
VLATVSAGPSNITRVGEQVARSSLHQAIDQACAAAGIVPAELANSCIGAAGAAREEGARKLQSILAEKLPAPFQLVGDMEIALHAAFGNSPGVIVIAGTGSIAYGRGSQGNTARAGGWGFSISDEGSAHWIGRQAVTAVLRAADQDPTNVADAKADSLFREMASLWSVSTLHELAAAANSTPNFATLFPAVLAAANAGDATAQQVLTQASAELARLASLVLHRLFPQTKAASSPSLAMVGGVFRHSPLIREQFSSLVRTACAPVNINPEVVKPVQGALQMARTPPL